MADAIAGHTTNPTATSVWRIRLLGGEPYVGEVILESGPNPFSADYNGEIIIKLDWAELSSPFNEWPLPVPDWTSTGAIADAFAEYLLQTNVNGRYWIEQPLHLIGFSRGASVVCALSERLGEAGVWVDQLTTIDPHPVDGINEDCDCISGWLIDFGDAPVSVYNKVVFADNYWRADGCELSGFWCDPDGQATPGSLSVELDESDLSPSGYLKEHYDVHLWYHGTIDTSSSAYDGVEFVPTDWYNYTDNLKGPRSAVGFNWTRIAGGSVAEDPARAGYHAALGGLGSRVSVEVDLSVAQWPSIMAFHVDGATQYTAGVPIRVNYYYQDQDSYATATFYLDPDRNPYNGNERLLGDRFLQRTTGFSPWSDGAYLDTSGTPAGWYYVLVKVTDGPRKRSAHAERIEIRPADPCTRPNKATSPVPANNATNVALDADLDWAPVSGATYDVYFGTDSSPDSGELLGSTGTSIWTLDPLTAGTTYYWRINTRNSCGPTTGNVWSFATCNTPPVALSPSPPDGATNVRVDTGLGWASVPQVTQYDVYLGTNATPPFVGSSVANSWGLPNLAWETTYYWRIAPRNTCGATLGPVWNFTTEPRPAVTVTSPNGGETWSRGCEKAISWTSRGRAGDYVQIELLKSGTVVETIAVATQNDGAYPWTPDHELAADHDYGVRVTSLSFPDAADISNATFALKEVPIITVTSPNGDEVWQAGGTATVTWEAVYPEGDVVVWLTSPITRDMYLGSAPMADGTLTADLCRYLPNATDYTVRVSRWVGDCDVRDASNAPFAIGGMHSVPTLTVTSPKRGDVWQPGETYAVRWNTEATSGSIWASLHHEYAPNGPTLFTAPATARFFTYQVSTCFGNGVESTVHLKWFPDPEAAQCIPFSTPWISVVAESEPFVVLEGPPEPTVTITRPVGSEQWGAGTTETITWDATNPRGDVRLQVCQYTCSGLGGVPYSFVTQVPMISGRADWPICPYLQDGEYQVCVYSLDECGDGHSCASIQIEGGVPFPLEITRPVAGAVWTAGTAETIEWSFDLSIADVSMLFFFFSSDSRWFDPVDAGTGRLEFIVPTCLEDRDDYRLGAFPLLSCSSLWSWDRVSPITVRGGRPPFPRYVAGSFTQSGANWVWGNSYPMTWRFEHPVAGVLDDVPVEVFLMQDGPPDFYRKNELWGRATLGAGEVLIDLPCGLGTTDLYGERWGYPLFLYIDSKPFFYGGQHIRHRRSDFDTDCDVDPADLENLVRCLRGPGVSTSGGCEHLDIDASGSVDLFEFAVLQTEYTGPR